MGEKPISVNNNNIIIIIIIIMQSYTLTRISSNLTYHNVSVTIFDKKQETCGFHYINLLLFLS